VSCDYDTGIVHFFAGLQRVTAIGKKRSARGFNQQDCGATAESAYVPYIGQMSDKQGVGTVLRKRKPELMDSAPA
jgi:hypothetical protein